jgi:hypothetical protein
LLKKFSCPFSIDVEDSLRIVQIELIDMQCNSDLEEKYENVAIFDFYSKYFENGEFSAVRSHALFMISLFGSTYVCEQLFSWMNVK